MEMVTDTKHELVILDATGDTKIIWDADKPAEVDQARKTFNELKQKGYTAYTVNKKGDQGEVIREFDPNAEKMILAPRTVGG